MIRHFDKVGRKTKKQLPIPYKSINASGNKVKVYKDNEEHTIYKCDLQWYLENGWHIGRNPNNKKSLALSETAKNASSGKGKKIIHNKELQQIKRVNPNELQYYLSIGWERGYLNK